MADFFKINIKNPCPYLWDRLPNFRTVTPADIGNVQCYIEVPPKEKIETKIWEQIWQELQSHVNSDQLSVEEVTELPTTESATSIVVCPVTDRVEASIDRTFRNIRCHKNMVLLILHHDAPHVQSKPPTKERLTRRQFDQLGDVIDFRFWHTDGLYDCDTNKAGFSNLEIFLKSMNRTTVGPSGEASSITRPVAQSSSVTGRIEHPSDESPVSWESGDRSADDDWVVLPREQQGESGDYIGQRKLGYRDKQQVRCCIKIAPETNLLGADKELLTKVKVNLETDNIELKTEEKTQAEYSGKTIILCPVTSRLGSNAMYAMKDVHGHQNMALICFHHVSPHTTFNSDSQSVLLDDKFRRLGAIVDVVFWDSLGMYDCSVNQSAVRRLCDFII